ncbi:probable prolyl 4-hydroxylase 10 [Papaver somniferum]|uniref:probable prolyl 4-hydroxylase 10 n=1 Tax=Papaver somniferum TaxID=3469 RepID=UPI000E6FA9E3|nr:probable prolyl 4-hydroxylase 10 [Papaver somniferum]
MHMAPGLMSKERRNSRITYMNKKSLSLTPILAMLLFLSFLIFILLFLGILSLPITSDGFPKAYDLTSFVRGGRRSTIEILRSKNDRGEQWMEVISWEPRAFIYHNFLSSKECDYLISIGEPRMKKSTVIDVKTGGSTASKVRTSSGMFMKRGVNEVIKDIEERIADFTHIPVEHGEGLQILHYEVGQKYEPHYDYFEDEFNTKKHGGQRIATLLMYLSDVEEGGETVFPRAKGNVSYPPWEDESVECGKKGLAVKPKKGDALLFWSLKPDATKDLSSLHGGCPVIKGNKWSSTKWMHVGEFP